MEEMGTGFAFSPEGDILSTGEYFNVRDRKMMLKGKGVLQAYGDESYWDTRYSQDVGSFDWYQQYAGMAPLINMYLPKESNLLMVGCGNAVISEDMVNDGYQTIMNIDISQIVIDAMIEKYKGVPQLQYQRMDVRLLAFKEGEFDSILDKGMLDSLMCRADAPASAASMIKEVCRILKPGGVYMLITYGDPRVRMPHLKSKEIPWEIKLHVIPRPGSRRAQECSSRPITESISFQEDGITLGSTFNLEDPDLHYVYVCTKEGVSAALPPEKKPPEKEPPEKKMSKRISHKK